MSNVKHTKSEFRKLAAEARSRLIQNAYGAPAAPKNITPQQREIYLKLTELKLRGESVVNPIMQLADAKKLATLPHDERQRYILQISADYVSMRNMLETNTVDGKRQSSSLLYSSDKNSPL